MTALTICIIALIILLLLFLQKLSFRFILSNDYSITVDYSFFSLVFRKSGKNKERKQSKKPAIRPLTRSILRIIKSSKITVNKLHINNIGSDPFISHIATAGVLSSAYPILNLVFSLAKASELSETAFTREPSQKSDTLDIDIVLESELYNFFFSGIILLYEELKRRIVRSYVRKSN